MRGVLASLIIVAIAIGGFVFVQEKGGVSFIASATSAGVTSANGAYCGGVGRGGAYCADK